MLCTQLSRTFICRPFIGRCFVRLTTTDDKDVGRLGRSDPLERTQIYCAYSKTCNTIWLIMEQWVSNTDQQLTAYHMYPIGKNTYLSNAWLFRILMIKAVYSPEVNLSGSVVDSQWSRRARDTAATMLDHSRHRGESATKTVKFFAAHTVNCVICKNLTRIDWMLLNFTPVIQQNCHQPGRNFEKTFCAVDRLSCQLELSNLKPALANSEAILLLIS